MLMVHEVHPTTEHTESEILDRWHSTCISKARLRGEAYLIVRLSLLNENEGVTRSIVVT